MGFGLIKVINKKMELIYPYLFYFVF